MRNKVRQRFKRLLTRVGTTLSSARLHQMQMVVNYMRLGRWMRDNGYSASVRVPDRKAVFDVVANQVCDKKVLYLEFGVYEGDSIRYWSERLTNPESSLHGFDSFEGLPEDFDFGGRYPKGTFDVSGRIPEIDDPRVHFHKGWFDEVLPGFELPDHDVLVITLDADLYSSTICVLRHLRAAIKPGVFVYLDDMSRPDHEPKAFQEFCTDTGLRFELVATDVSLNNSFFVCVAGPD